MTENSDIPRNTVDKKTCKYCGVIKRTPADLKRHIRMHTGERPFNCSQCGKAFKAKRTSQIHKYIHHGLIFKDTNIATKYKAERLKFLKKGKERSIIRNFSTKNNFSESPAATTNEFATETCIRNAQFEIEDMYLNSESDSTKDNIDFEVQFGETQKEYQCSFCTCQFKAYSTLKYHLRRDHGRPIYLSKSWEDRFKKLHVNHRGPPPKNMADCLDNEDKSGRYTPIVVKYPSLEKYSQFYNENMSANPNMNISFVGKINSLKHFQEANAVSIKRNRNLITEYLLEGSVGPKIVFSCELCQTLFSSFAMCTLHLTEHCKDSTFSNEISSLSDIIVRVETNFMNGL